MESSYIVLAVLVILVIIFGAWFWYLNKNQKRFGARSGNGNFVGGVLDPFRATLRPAAGVVSRGSGQFDLVATSDPAVYTYTVRHQNLTGPVTAAHIHYKSNKDIAYPFSGSNGTIAFRPEDLPIRDQFYVNVHTNRYPDGEITGDLVEY